MYPAQTWWGRDIQITPKERQKGGFLFCSMSYVKMFAVNMKV